MAMIASTTAVDVLCDATIRASVGLLHDGRFPRIAARPKEWQYQAIPGVLRQTLKVRLPGYMAEWKEAIDANLSEGWLRELVNAQAVEAAMKAMAILEEEL